jgi:DNA helicase-2/ATP-dependent DNA helicase PcrA
MYNGRMPLSAKFAAALKALNPEQRLAVKALEGPVMVLAGPGTGKTEVLTLRIANLLDRGLAEPNQILALTFTNAAAANMRERLTRLIGSSALAVNFNTFHGFCQEVLEQQREHLPLPEHAISLDDLERISFLEQIITTLPLQVLRPAGKKYYYLSTLSGALATLKQEGITLERYEQLLAQAREMTQLAISEEETRPRPRQARLKTLAKNLAKQEELGLVYAEYQKMLFQRQRYDFADMILLVLAAFKTQPDLLAHYQEQYQYLLVDEYQDTNNAQGELLLQLASFWGEQANLFVVGDPEQAIYRFQGANLENFLGFTKHYPQAKKIILQTGYRCHDKTYALAHELTLTAPQSERLDDTLLHHYRHTAGTPAVFAACPTRDSELLWLLGKIKDLHQAGTPLSEMAVIYRNNQESERLKEIATALNLAYTTDGGEDLLADPHVKQLLGVLKLLAALDEPYLAETYLHQIIWQPWLGLDQLALLQLQQRARTNKQLLLEAVLSPDSQAGLTLSSGQTLGQTLLALKAASANLPLTAFLHQVLQDLQFLTWLKKQPQAWINLANLYAFERVVDSWSQTRANFDLSALLQHLATIKEHQLTLPAPKLTLATAAVTFTTAHKAKGRQWQYVFTCGLQKNNWDKGHSAKKLPLPAGILSQQLVTDPSSDNRRLFYVAATRASKTNFFSWHLTDPVTPEKPQLPASFAFFLEDLVAPGLTIAAPEVSLTPETVVTQLTTLLTPPPKRELAFSAQEFLRQRAQTLTLSASMLNDYLADPELFLERYLLQAPNFEINVPLEFGNSLHRTLEQVVKAKLVAKSYLPLKEAQVYFRHDFASKPLPEPEKSAYLQSGLESLSKYYDDTLAKPDCQPLACEQVFGFSAPLHLDQVPLKGKIDRIDIVDKTARQVAVLDYKTGRVLSPRELQGEDLAKLSEREKTLPLPIRAPAKRQLLFYKLLTELDPKFKKEVTTGVLDFVKCTSSQKPTRRQIALDSADLLLLKTLIKQVWQEIQTLTPWC